MGGGSQRGVRGASSRGTSLRGASSGGAPYRGASKSVGSQRQKPVGSASRANKGMGSKGVGSLGSRGSSRVGGKNSKYGSVRSNPVGRPGSFSNVQAGRGASIRSGGQFAERTSRSAAPSMQGAGRGAGRSSGRNASGSYNRGYQQVPNQNRGSVLHSVSVQQARKNAKAPRSLGGFVKVLIAVAVIAVLLAITWTVLSFTNVLPVKKITVSGVEHLTQQDVTSLAAVPDGSTMFNIDSEGIAKRLEGNPWVDSVVVERLFPETINLKVKERGIAAICVVNVDDAHTTEKWALSSDGTWLMKIPDRNSTEGQAIASKVYEDAEKALTISGVPYSGNNPEAGKPCNNANISNALSIVDNMSTELSQQVKTVSATSATSTHVTLNNGVEIVFGDSSDLREKERVCLKLMEEHQGKISYINVSVVNKPVWRSV